VICEGGQYAQAPKCINLTLFRASYNNVHTRSSNHLFVIISCRSPYKYCFSIIWYYLVLLIILVLFGIIIIFIRVALLSRAYI